MFNIKGQEGRSSVLPPNPRRKRQSSLVFLPADHHGQRSCWVTIHGVSESDTLSTHTDRLRAKAKELGEERSGRRRCALFRTRAQLPLGCRTKAYAKGEDCEITLDMIHTEVCKSGKVIKEDDFIGRELQTEKRAE